MSECRFFIVWSPQGVNPPRYRHADRESALREAERLAELHRGEFYVLQAISRSRKVTVATEILADDELPF